MGLYSLARDSDETFRQVVHSLIAICREKRSMIGEAPPCQRHFIHGKSQAFHHLLHLPLHRRLTRVAHCWNATSTMTPMTHYK